MPSPPIRALIIEDDADVTELLRTILTRRLGCDVRTLPSTFGAIDAIREFAPDVLLTDVELPGASGLDLLATVHEVDPSLSCIVMTAHPSVDYAVRALRDKADEFLLKPIASAVLVEAVERLAAASRQRRTQRQRRTVLAVGAHPDDVEIGVGGTLAAHAAAGDPIVILTLSRGARGGDAEDRQHESLAVAELLGARLFLEDLPDTAIPGNDPTVGIIETVVAEVAPHVVYTHSRHDRHQDHRAVHDATLIASRHVEHVACYESPSATIDFRPTRFVTIDDHIGTKLDLLRCYASQFAIRDYLDPEFVLATARYWSRFGTGRHSEPLEIIRDARGIDTPAPVVDALSLATESTTEGES